MCLSTAAVAQTISYQGTIAKSDGAPAEGTHRIAVSLWTSENGDSPIWTDEFVTNVTHGVFDLKLGSSKPLPKAEMDKQLWITIGINGEQPTTWTRLSAVPFALSVADSSITSRKIATDYVGSISINGQKLTGRGTTLNIETKGIDASFDEGSSSLMLVLTGATSSKGAKIQSSSTGLGDWCEQGNYGPWNFGGTAYTPFLGTTDNTPLIFKTGNGTGANEAMRILSNTSTNLQYVGINTANPSSRLDIQDSNSRIVVIDTVLTISRKTSGNPGKGFGIEQHALLQTYGSGNLKNASRFKTYWTDARTDSATSAYELELSTGGDTDRVLQVAAHHARVQDQYGNPLWTSAPSITWGAHSSRWTGTGNSIPDSIVGGTVSGGGGFWDPVDNDTWCWNTVTSHWATVGGGAGNRAGILYGDSTYKKFQTVGGGLLNTASGDDAVVAGGEYDSATGFHSAILGGSHNQALGSYSAVLGGQYNHAEGEYATVLGGSRLKLGGHSVGYSPVTADLTSQSGIGYFGNVDLWIGNVDHRSRALRFLTPYSGARPDLAGYTAIRAADTQTSNITYTLPLSLPDSEGWVLTAQTITADTVGLAWGPGGSGGGGAGWLLIGNRGTFPPTNFLGTRDDSPFEIHLHNDTAVATGGNHRVMRYEEGITSPNIVGCSSANTLAAGLSGSAILSGGTSATPNQIDSNAPFSLIASGNGNHILGMGNLAGYSAILSGRGNLIGADSFRSWYNVIAGGDSNLIGWGSYGNSLGGGFYNTIANAYGTIAGGYGNLLNGSGALNVIGGGRFNTVGGDISVNAQTERSTISGGDSNMISEHSWWAFIGGGGHNTIGPYSIYGAISGGSLNSLGRNAGYSSILSGQRNRVEDTVRYSTIAGGQFNTIVSNDTLYHSEFRAAYNFIGAGDSNRIDGFGERAGGDPARGSAIVAGHANTVHEAKSFIGSGSYNEISDDAGFIGTGLSDTISDGSENAIIAGRNNTIDITTIATSGVGAAFIGSGVGNIIKGAAAYAAIPAGDHNIATVNSQTVIGKYNDSLAFGQPLLSVGNGSPGARHDGFDVSAKGAATVYDLHGPSGGGIPGPRAGATYVDNVLIAEADVDANRTLASSFGVYSVAESDSFPGSYLVELDINDSKANRDTLKEASIVVSLRSNDTSGFSTFHAKHGGLILQGTPETSTTCGWSIDATQIGIVEDLTAPEVGRNTFIVHIRPPGDLAHCLPLISHAFFFQVFGRRARN